MKKFVDNRARKDEGKRDKPEATHKVLDKTSTDDLRREVERRQKEPKK